MKNMGIRQLTLAASIWCVLAAVLTTSVEARSIRSSRRNVPERGDHRADRRDHRQDHRTVRRVVRRVARRHYYAPPRAHRVVVIHGHRYYFWGGVYYYPYYFGGRVVYVEINLVNGSPIAPPPANQIRVEINF